jgi:hypothetical protein
MFEEKRRNEIRKGAIYTQRLTQLLRAKHRATSPHCNALSGVASRDPAFHY